MAAVAQQLTDILRELSYRCPKANGMDVVEDAATDAYRVRCWRYRRGRTLVGFDLITAQVLRHIRYSRDDFTTVFTRCLDTAYRQIVGPEDFWPFRIGRRGPRYLRAAP
jgi:hypothetical protein